MDTILGRRRHFCALKVPGIARPILLLEVHLVEGKASKEEEVILLRFYGM
jgi:hypothetical protein